MDLYLGMGLSVPELDFLDSKIVTHNTTRVRGRSIAYTGVFKWRV